jgi:hypothetical protein
MSTISLSTRDEVLAHYHSRLADPVPGRKKLLPKKDFEILVHGFVELLIPLSDPSSIDSLIRQELTMLESGLRNWELTQEYLPVYIYLIRAAIDDSRISLPPNKTLYPALRILLAYQQGESLDSIPLESSDSPVIDRLLSLSDPALLDRITELSDELRKLQDLYSIRSGLAPNSDFVMPHSYRKSLNAFRKCRMTVESVIHWNKMTDDSLRRFIINDRLITRLTAMKTEFVCAFITGHSDSINLHHRELNITHFDVLENQKNHWRANILFRNPDFFLLLNHCNQRLEFGGTILLQPEEITPFPS